MRLGRLAVDASARRRGIAAALLGARPSARARDTRRPRSCCTRQTDARSLYEHAGYAARGDAFVEAGIEHVAMEKPLA